MKTDPGAAAVAAPARMARTAMERSNLYGFLAAIFREEPTPALLAQMKGRAFRAALSGAGVALDDDFLQRPEGELLGDLAVEYTRLFIGPGKHVSPHESAQMEGVLWGQRTSAVVRFIEASGLRYRPEYRGVPDHISVEFDFMGDMTAREAKAWKRSDQGAAKECLATEERFLSDHLFQWIPKLCEKVIAASELPFYREMAKLTRAFIESESKEVPRWIAGQGPASWSPPRRSEFDPFASAPKDSSA
ncbi:MAG: molecular chaperone [Alphaproteobacteria bacterium]